jgi:hypothetical protein
MQMSMAVRRAATVVCAAVGLLLAALSARPAAAQGFGYAAIAISPSTMWAGAEKGATTENSVDYGALQYCQNKGAKDCKIYSVVGGCVALAVAATPVPNQYGVSTGATRGSAAAEALALCAKDRGINCVVSLAPCGSDDVRFASPLPLPPGGKPGSVDPAVVGLWGLNVNGGIWVWQITANGTYQFHSEATDGTLPNNGTFAASNGKYTDHSIMMQWDDQGTYTMQGTTAMVMTGKSGTGTWYRMASDPVYGSGSAPGSGITIRR